MAQLHPRQIAKVAYEAIRAYSATIADPEMKPWEATTETVRDAFVYRTDLALAGSPFEPFGFDAGGRVKARLLARTVEAFTDVYRPRVAVMTAQPAVAEPDPVIPVEVFSAAEDEAGGSGSTGTAAGGPSSDEAPPPPPAN